MFALRSLLNLSLWPSILKSHWRPRAGLNEAPSGNCSKLNRSPSDMYFQITLTPSTRSGGAPEHFVPSAVTAASAWVTGCSGLCNGFWPWDLGILFWRFVGIFLSDWLVFSFFFSNFSFWNNYVFIQLFSPLLIFKTFLRVIWHLYECAIECSAWRYLSG